MSYNRYAYVRNNPLKYIDPSGHSFWGWFKKIAGAFIGAAVGAAITAVTLGAMAGAQAIVSLSIAQFIIAGSVGGLIGGAVAGGITGGMTGMMMGAIFGMIGGAISGGFSQGVEKLGMAGFALALGVGAGLSYATGGWEGLLTFGVGLLGGYAGSKIGKSISINYKSSVYNRQGHGKQFTQQEIKEAVEKAYNSSYNSGENCEIFEDLKNRYESGKVYSRRLPDNIAAQYNPITGSITVDGTQIHKYLLPGALVHESFHRVSSLGGFAEEFMAHLHEYNFNLTIQAVYPSTPPPTPSIIRIMYPQLRNNLNKINMSL